MEVLRVLQCNLEERIRHDLMVHFEASSFIWMDFLDDFRVSLLAQVEIDLEMACQVACNQNVFGQRHGEEEVLSRVV